MPVSLWSRANSCSCLFVGIVGSKPAEGHECSSNVFAVCCAVSGLCDLLISRSEESCRVCVCVWVWFRNLKRETAQGRIAIFAPHNPKILFKATHWSDHIHRSDEIWVPERKFHLRQGICVSFSLRYYTQPWFSSAFRIFTEWEISLKTGTLHEIYPYLSDIKISQYANFVWVSNAFSRCDIKSQIPFSRNLMRYNKRYIYIPRWHSG